MASSSCVTIFQVSSHQRSKFSSPLSAGLTGFGSKYGELISRTYDWKFVQCRGNETAERTCIELVERTPMETDMGIN